MADTCLLKYWHNGTVAPLESWIMKILIAIDNSECSLQAFNSVLSNCWPVETEFKVITIVEPFVGLYPIAYTYVDSMSAAEQELKKQAHEFIKTQMEQFKEKFPMSAVSGAVYEGVIAETILEKAKSFNADLIVLGSHSRKGLDKFLLGSVAERVAAHAQCSVEIVKSKRPATPTAEKEAAVSGRRSPSKEI